MQIHACWASVGSISANKGHYRPKLILRIYDFDLLAPTGSHMSHWWQHEWHQDKTAPMCQ